MDFSEIIWYIGVFLLVIFVAFLVYALLVLIGILVPLNRSFQAQLEGVDFYLSTNGLHTSFILPSKHEVFDWTHLIDNRLFELNLASSYLSFGWGDRAIYLDLPEWNQLTLGLAVRTLLLPTPSLLHLTALDQLPSGNLKKIRISTTQYRQLSQYILDTFAFDEQQNVKCVLDAGYTPNDNFYCAHGAYHAFRTCNSWVSKGLRIIGVRTPLWTPIDRGVFYQVNKIKSTLDLKN